MPIYPSFGPEYYNADNPGILARINEFYAESVTINQAFWQEADTDTRFWAGDQTLWNELFGNVPINRRKMFTFNRIRRVVDMVTGHQRKNRKSIVVVPVENGVQSTADQYTKLFYSLNNSANLLETLSEGFEGALVTGMNLLQVYLDYRNDPVSGDIRVDNCSYNSFLIDPYFRKPDLSDCNAILKRTFISKQTALSMFPNDAEKIMAMAPQDNRDGKFQFMPENYNYALSRLFPYDEFYYRDYRLQKLIVDTETGETYEWRKDDPAALKEFLQLYPQLTMIEQSIPTVRVAMVLQGHVMYDGYNPLGIDCYPFIPLLGYYTPQLPYYSWRVQGMVRGLRDAQYLYNRRKVIELDILESQVNSGFIYKENALVNPADVFLSGQGRGIALKEEAQISDVIQIQAPQVPQSMIELSNILSAEINQISGVNEELLGSASDDKAGILSMLRQGAGLTTLQKLFDQLDLSTKMLGGVIMNVMQANYTPGKVQRIINEQPAPEFYNKAFRKYDIAVEEGLNTTTQRQMQFAQLLQLREAGVPVPADLLLEASTMQNKTQLVEAVRAQEQQQAQMAQQQMQAQMQLQSAQSELAHARSQADQGLAVERASRVEENQALAVERRAEAQKIILLGYWILLRL